MASNSFSYNGWPNINYGTEMRSDYAISGSDRTVIIYPRSKFTFFVEFNLSDDALASDRVQTTFPYRITDGKVYAVVRSISLPRYYLDSERLKSYNKDVVIPTKAHLQQGTLRLHDDNASIAAALCKEVKAFYSYSGSLGNRGASTSAVTDFRSGNALTGSSTRNSSDTRPSMGLTLRNDSSRHFFNSIIVYDLGADPASVNVYEYIYPMIVSMQQDERSYEDRTGQSGITLTFEAEEFSQVIGCAVDEISDAYYSAFGYTPYGDTGATGYTTDV